MPAIPTYESNMAAQANKRIIEQPTFAPDNSMGNALLKVADVGTEIAQRVDKANTDREVVTANRLAQEQIEKAKFDLEQNQDIKDEEIQPTLRKTAESILEATGKGISSSRARDMWSEQAKGSLLLDGDNWARKQQLQRGADRAQGAHVAAISSLNDKAGDPTIKPEVFAGWVNDEATLIARNEATGVISHEYAARLKANLDDTIHKDRMGRWSGDVILTARSGDFEGAQKKVAEEKGLTTAEREDALSGIERERNKQEVERNKAWQLAGNEYEVSILDGKGSRKGIDDAVAAGKLNPNDKPALIRMVREEEDRQKREAIAAATLSAAEKEAWKDQSADNRASFEALAGYDAATFMQPDKWSDDDRRAFSAMTPDDQRAIRIKINGMATTGVTSDAKTKVFGDLMTEAKRWAPPSWKLDSEKDGVRSWPRRMLDSLLMKTAEEMAPQLGGNALQQKQAQEIVGRVLSKIDPKADWSTIPSVAYNKAVAEAGLDPSWSKSMAVVDDRPSSQDYQKAASELKARTGIEPSPSDVQRLLAARSGQPAVKK